MVFIAIPAGYSFGNPVLLVIILAIIIVIALIVLHLTRPKEQTPEKTFADLADQKGGV